MDQDEASLAKLYGDDIDPDTAVYDQWGPLVYLIVTLSVCSILVIAYLVTLYRAISGTTYSFIVVLLTLLLISNISSIAVATYNHKTNVFIRDAVIYYQSGEPIDLEQGVN